MKVKKRALGILLMFLLISPKALISFSSFSQDGCFAVDDQDRLYLPLHKKPSIFSDLVREVMFFCCFPLNCFMNLVKDPCESTSNEDMFLTVYLENKESL